MKKTTWTPWHQVVQLREDLKSGELTLAAFAADLDDVVMERARPVYQKPEQFFALTYPTFNLRELAKDVIVRLAAKSDKAVRQLVLTYGGGKTHALITLLHLVSDPERLPDLPAVHEFTQHIGVRLPKARAAVLAFDRLDPVTGMDVRAPDGTTARWKYPWSVLAYQLGGREGLRLLGCVDGREREEPPFTNVLEELLRLPGKEGLSPLILIDEVLMWARTKIDTEPVWHNRLEAFFQCLTQAATKVDTCAIVASLLASDPRKNDTLGKEILRDLSNIFRRQQEEPVEPVVKEDVAEVLRRRFFTPDSVRDRALFRPHVVAALQGVTELDEQIRKEGQAAEERFLKSYPFHPDLTDIFYTKWTNLEGFQRTRGVLRTFALALRDAEKWDDSPLVGVGAFLSQSGDGSISEAARELTTIAETEEYEGKRQAWTNILDGEFAKAREIQLDFPSLRHREMEQAVFATFLHSQPIGQRALTRDLLVHLGASRPDRIEMEKGLRRWADSSWFLDEAAINDAESGPDGQKLLPKSWRLGSRPNLRHMHDDARKRVSPDLVEAKLLSEIGKLRSLTVGASAAGARVHNLPERPRDIEDDGEFHYAVLGPKAASHPGKPSAEARRFLDEKTGPDSPRVYRNAVVLVVPSHDGLETARNRIRDYLAWEEVRSMLKDQEVDPSRLERLTASLEAERKKIPDAIQQAYAIVVTVSEKNEAEAFKVTVTGEPLFSVIRGDIRSRVQDTAISAEALLPEGPYDLWREGETSRRVKDLVGAFAQFPHLPKMLNRQAILDTLVDGCVQGMFVLRLARPDGSARTFWRQRPDEVALKEPGLEVVLPEAATLGELSPALLASGALPGLWQAETIRFGDLCSFFAGGRVVKVQREGYDEPVTIPQASRAVVEAAVGAAVREGKLWLTCGRASIFREEIPVGLLSDDAILQPPPQPVSALEVLRESVPEAWSNGSTTALAISASLSSKAGKTLPWAVVREAISGAIQSRFIELTLDSAPWPCDYAGAATVKLRVPLEPQGGRGVEYPLPEKWSRERVYDEGDGVLVAAAELRPSQLQDLAEMIGDITRAAAGLQLKFHLTVELGGPARPPDPVTAIVNELLQEVSEGLMLQ